MSRRQGARDRFGPRRNSGSLAMTAGLTSAVPGRGHPNYQSCMDSTVSEASRRSSPSRRVSGLRPRPTSKPAADSRLSASEGPKLTLSPGFRARGPETGGEGGIRTHGSLSTTTAFEAGRFNHSRTSPRNFLVGDRGSYRAEAPSHRPPRRRIPFAPRSVVRESRAPRDDARL